MVNKKILKFNIDITDNLLLDCLFETYGPFDVVVHLAALKSVTESNSNHGEYIKVNVDGGLKLIRVMKKYKCNKIVFSSTSAVYGDAIYLPIDENHPTRPKSVYGRTKLIYESMLSASGLTSICLRFFNVTGAHPSGKIGEKSKEIPQNLIPCILRVIEGKIS